jgi:glycosyltransferase involved in cell wall biosynthesis
MDWIVFGDDWGVHPSTTQHLVRHLHRDDCVLWVDSIGMRAPQFRRADVLRIAKKLRSIAAPDTVSSIDVSGRHCFARLAPKVLPWHRRRTPRRINSRLLSRDIKRKLAILGISRPPVLLSATPVVAHYLDAVPHSRLCYLRLDDYTKFTGGDPKLVRESEARMFDRCDVVFATARTLLPPGPAAAKAIYLPQGVDSEHFARVPVEPPPASRRTLGFFGLLDERVDYDLVRRVAAAAPDWQLEFVGPVRLLPKDVEAMANVAVLPPVSFDDLPRAISHWSAAWIPYTVCDVTEGVNPLKVREYLAAGLPTLSTPLPEVAALAEEVEIAITKEASDVVRWLEHTVANDSAAGRRKRRSSIEPHSWRQRATDLRRAVEELS